MWVTIGGKTHTHTHSNEKTGTHSQLGKNKQTTQNSKRNYGEQNSVFK